MNPALECGIDPNDGILLAYLPKLDSVMQEHYSREHVVFAQDGTVIDMLPLGKSRTVKWWKVREAARALGLSIIEPIWSGAASEFRVPEVPALAGQFSGPCALYMRSFSQGPWIKLDGEHERICNEDEQALSSQPGVAGPEEASAERENQAV